MVLIEKLNIHFNDITNILYLIILV